MNLGDSADIDTEVLNQTGYRTDGARTLSRKMEVVDREPGIITKIVGKDVELSDIDHISGIFPDENVIADVLECRSYKYSDGSYQDPEEVLNFLDELTSSNLDRTPELVFPDTIIDGLYSIYEGKDRISVKQIEEALDDMGTILKTDQDWDISVDGNLREDAMICRAASEYTPEGTVALAMTNDDHFRALTDPYDNVIEASPVYTMKTVREKGLII